MHVCIHLRGLLPECMYMYMGKQVQVNIHYVCMQDIMHVHIRSVIMRPSFQLFCSFCATFTFNLLLSASTSQGFIDRPGQVDFGTFEVCVANYII